MAKAGDDGIFPGEQCDGYLVNRGACLGLIPAATGGALACGTNRQLDTSGCTFDHRSCGDTVIDADEQCDGLTIGISDCAELGYELVLLPARPTAPSTARRVCLISPPCSRRW